MWTVAEVIEIKDVSKNCVRVISVSNKPDRRLHICLTLNCNKQKE